MIHVDRLPGISLVTDRPIPLREQGDGLPESGAALEFPLPHQVRRAAYGALPAWLAVAFSTESALCHIRRVTAVRWYANVKPNDPRRHPKGGDC